MEFPSEALALKSPFYVERPPVESLCYQNLSVPGSLTRIKASRHMGKSSLLVRMLEHARSLGYKTVLIDFKSAESDSFSSLNKFLRWFCTAVARQLQLPPALADYWDEETGAKLSTTIYFEDYLFESLDTPLVLALNEVNRVFEHPEIAQDFLPLLRFWYEQAKQGTEFAQMRTVVVHSTDIYVPLNIHQSPFNVGLPVQLQPFSADQTLALAQRYGLTLTDAGLLDDLMSLLGGHPYLLSLAFYHMATQQLDLAKLLTDAPTPAGIYQNHLQECLTQLQQQPLLVDALRRVVSSAVPVVLDISTAHQLASLGLVIQSGDTCRPSCELYRMFFAQHGLPKYSPAFYFQQLKAENEQLRALANLDGLTRIANRRVLDEQLQIIWRSLIMQGLPLSLIMLDIDCFKAYNDTYGHQAGDDCLKQVAQVLKTRLRKADDLAARYGGEEFAILLPRTGLAEATTVAAHIHESIQAMRVPHQSSIVASRIITASIGVASVIPSEQQPVSGLITAADKALYISKQQGRDRVTAIDACVGEMLPRVG